MILSLLVIAAAAALPSPPQPAGAGSAKEWVRVPLESGGLVTVPCPAAQAGGGGDGDGGKGVVTSCRLTPEASVTFDADGRPAFGPATTATGGGCQCHVPPVDAVGAATLAFSSDNVTFVDSDANLVFYATWSVTLKAPWTRAASNHVLA